MNTTRIYLKALGILFFAFFLTDRASAQTTSIADGSVLSNFITEYLQDRVRIGTRLGGSWLTDSDSGHKGGTYGSGTYLGTIYGLKEKNRWLPNKPYLAYGLTPCLEVEVAYEKMTNTTLATDSDTGLKKSDGDAVLAGPTLSLIAKYPHDSQVVPSIGIGLGFFNGDFLETAEWAASDWGTSQRRRQMVVDSTLALLVTAGLSWNFADHWAVDCSLQYIRADSDATFYGFTDGVLDTEQTGHFPFDSFALRVGLAYAF